MLDQVNMVNVLRNPLAEVKVIIRSRDMAMWQHVEDIVQLHVCNNLKLTCAGVKITEISGRRYSNKTHIYICFEKKCQAPHTIHLKMNS